MPDPVHATDPARAPAAYRRTRPASGRPARCAARSSGAWPAGGSPPGRGDHFGTVVIPRATRPRPGDSPHRAHGQHLRCRSPRATSRSTSSTRPLSSIAEAPVDPIVQLKSRDAGDRTSLIARKASAARRSPAGVRSGPSGLSSQTSKRAQGALRIVAMDPSAPPADQPVPERSCSAPGPMRLQFALWLGARIPVIGRAVRKDHTAAPGSTAWCRRPAGCGPLAVMIASRATHRHGNVRPNTPVPDHRCRSGDAAPSPVRRGVRRRCRYPSR